MQKFTSRSSDELAAVIKDGGIGVILTDTIYGLVADANNEQAVERVYKTRSRDLEKPCIVLIDNLSQIWDVDVPLRYEEVIKSYWPGRVSILLPAADKTPAFIHRGYNGTVAFRMPDDPELRALLKKTGPLIAPSANPAGENPAADITEAEGYFGESIDFYVDSGICTNTTPSRIIRLQEDGTLEVLR